MFEINEIAKKKGFYWSLFTELLILSAAIYAFYNGNISAGVLFLILSEIRSYIFTQSK